MMYLAVAFLLIFFMVRYWVPCVNEAEDIEIAGMEQARYSLLCRQSRADNYNNRKEAERMVKTHLKDIVREFKQAVAENKSPVPHGRSSPEV